MFTRKAKISNFDISYSLADIQNFCSFKLTPGSVGFIGALASAGCFFSGGWGFLAGVTSASLTLLRINEESFEAGFDAIIKAPNTQAILSSVINYSASGFLAANYAARFSNDVEHIKKVTIGAYVLSQFSPVFSSIALGFYFDSAYDAFVGSFVGLSPISSSLSLIISKIISFPTCISIPAVGLTGEDIDFTLVTEAAKKFAEIF